MNTRSKSNRRADTKGGAAVASGSVSDAPMTFGERMNSPFGLAMISGLMLWAAMPTFPDKFLSGLAWLAPVGWLLLIAREHLTGKRPQLQLYAASLIHALMVYQFVRLPHWAANFGWIALSLYLAIYPFAFVLISRTAVHRLRVPLVVVAPIVWTGLELFRGYFFTGLSTGLLGHTQVHWTQLIQVSDIAGAYAVSFLMMFVAACAVQAWQWRNRVRHCVGAVSIALVAIAATLVYGQVRIDSEGENPKTPQLKVALIQGSIDTIFPGSEAEAEDMITRSHDQYREISVKARQSNPDIDLIAWPETMLQDRVVLLNDKSRSKLTPAELSEWQNYQRYHPILVQEAIGTITINESSGSYAQNLPPIPAILGAATEVPASDPRVQMNSAVMVDPDGNITNSYHKMHPVPFGEFLPFGDWFPAIYALAPIPGALTRGERPECFSVNGICIAPSICFESIVPHLIRRQVCQLESAGTPPDVLLNITNDGWFWGSNALDLHLACNAFRAVEMRRPLLVCANTGFSAEIDGSGRIVQRGARRATDIIFASVSRDSRTSFYQRTGDWLAWTCLIATCLFLIAGFVAGRSRQRLDSRPSSNPNGERENP